MFTGIIVETGTVRSVAPQGESMSLEITARKALEGAARGDSIAVNGVCLTAVEYGADWFRADVGEETWRRTTLQNARPGVKVNLEPSLKMGDKMGGHQVMGHVDGVGSIAGRRADKTQTVFTIEHPKGLASGIAVKGSVAIDGISLTVGKCEPGRFEVYIIPATLAATTLGQKGPGDPVNIEIDVMARYIQRYLDAWLAENRPGGGSELEEKLKKFGYTS